MADINKTIKELEHKKDVDSNLAFYGNYMMSVSNRLAYIKAAMNAGTLFEMNMDIGCLLYTSRDLSMVKVFREVPVTRVSAPLS